MKQFCKIVFWAVPIALFCLFAARTVFVEAHGPAMARATPFRAHYSLRPVRYDELEIAAPETPAQFPSDAIVTYPFKTLDVQNDTRMLQEQYAGKAHIVLEGSPSGPGIPFLRVQASSEVQPEIRSIIEFLTHNQSDRPNNPIIAYSLQYVPVSDVVKRIEEHFGGRAEVTIDNSNLLIRAPRETQTEIQAVIKFLDRPSALSDRFRPGSSGGDPNRAALPQTIGGTEAARMAQLQTQIDTAITQLRNTTSEKDKPAVREYVRKLLADWFAADMRAREQQTAEIEARLTKLRQQYTARKKIKDEIIDLQMQVIENDASGLGFPFITPAPKTSRTNSDGSELPLAVLKKEQQPLVSQLTNLGHLAESADGSLYAHVAANHPRGPSIIRVVESASGRNVATVTVNAVVGPLQFTDEGVATREADGRLELRVPLNGRSRADTGDTDLGNSTTPLPPRNTDPPLNPQ